MTDAAIAAGPYFEKRRRALIFGLRKGTTPAGGCGWRWLVRICSTLGITACKKKRGSAISIGGAGSYASVVTGTPRPPIQSYSSSMNALMGNWGLARLLARLGANGTGRASG